MIQSTFFRLESGRWAERMVRACYFQHRTPSDEAAVHFALRQPMCRQSCADFTLVCFSDRSIKLREDKSISRVHATLIVHGASLTVRNDGGQFGTTVGGLDVKKGATMDVSEGDQVDFGNEKTCFIAKKFAPVFCPSQLPKKDSAQLKQRCAERPCPRLAVVMIVPYMPLCRDCTYYLIIGDTPLL